MASVASHSNKSPAMGDHIMVAGLAFQVFTLLIFMILCVDFGLRTRRRYKELGAAALDQSPLLHTLRNSWRFKGFLAALTLATICIFWRSVYRVVELGEGWQGHLIRQQVSNFFYVLTAVIRREPEQPRHFSESCGL